MRRLPLVLNDAQRKPRSTSRGIVVPALRGSFLPSRPSHTIQLSPVPLSMLCLDRTLPQDPVAPSPTFASQNASQDHLVAPSQPRCSPFPDSSLLLDRSRLHRAVRLHILTIEEAPRQQWLMPETPCWHDSGRKCPSLPSPDLFRRSADLLAAIELHRPLTSAQPPRLASHLVPQCQVIRSHDQADRKGMPHDRR